MDIVDRLHEARISEHAVSEASLISHLHDLVFEAREEITRLRKELASDLEEARSEGYEEGYSEGQSDCEAALQDFWGSMLDHLKKHDCEPPSDDGHSHTAGDMMEAVFEREGNLRREIESLRKERDEARAALEFYADADRWGEFASDEAASAFERSFGTDFSSDMGERARAALATQKATK